MKQANKHRYQDKSSECKTYSFQKRTLDYDRQAYGCRHYGLPFVTLEYYMDHLIRSCNSIRVSGRGHRNYQIRALLQQPRFEEKVSSICRGKWGAASTIKRLWWSWPQDDLADIVDRLEYGELDVEEGQLNCGISPKDVDGFLSNLINRSVLLPPEGLVISDNVTGPQSNELANSSTPLNGSSGVSKWLHSLQQSRPTISPTFQVDGAMLQDTTRCGSPNPLSTGIAHRPKRPVSDNSAQHPESTTRSGTDPFMGSPYNKMMVNAPCLEFQSTTNNDTSFLEVPSMAEYAFQQGGIPKEMPPSISPSQTLEPSTLQEEITDLELDDILAILPGRPDPPPPPPSIAMTPDAAVAYSNMLPHDHGEFNGVSSTELPPAVSLDTEIDPLAFDAEFFAFFSIPPPSTPIDIQPVDSTSYDLF